MSQCNLDFNINHMINNIHNHLDNINNKLVFKKMCFIYNALNNGWSVKLRKNKYIFTKKHENKKEIFSESYLKDFIEHNFTMTDKNI